MKLDATIFKGFGNAGKPKKAGVELFDLAADFFAILDQHGLAEEMIQTSLLGSIKVSKKICIHIRIECYANHRMEIC